MSSLTAIPDRRARRVPALLSKSRAAVLTLALLALFASAVLSGCSGLSEGPLGAKPENPTVLGQPVLRGGADTIGFDAVFNTGSAPVVIDRVVIRSPHHMKLLGAYVTMGGIIGNWVTFPPLIGSNQGDAFTAWTNRHKTAGAVIPPGQWAGIALGLKVTSAKGSTAGIDLFYHVGPADYEWHGHIRIVLTSVDCRAPSSAPARHFCRLAARSS